MNDNSPRTKALSDAWERINGCIKRGELPGPQHHQRNGLIIATNIIREMMDEKH